LLDGGLRAGRHNALLHRRLLAAIRVRRQHIGAGRRGAGDTHQDQSDLT
jgi:hypothetical protein